MALSGRNIIKTVCPEALGAGFPFRRVSWAQPAARITDYDACASLAGILHHFSGLDVPKGMPMMRKACADRHLRIIGRPCVDFAPFWDSKHSQNAQRTSPKCSESIAGCVGTKIGKTYELLNAST